MARLATVGETGTESEDLPVLLFELRTYPCDRRWSTERVGSRVGPPEQLRSKWTRAGYNRFHRSNWN